MKKIKLKKQKNLIKAKDILKDNKATVTIKERTPSPYINRFFKDEQEDAEMQYFFK